MTAMSALRSEANYQFFQNDIWLSAFEEFLISRGLANSENLETLREAWTEAYLTTPHGSPVHLSGK
ncbi:MAG: hypothetical protein O3A84_05260 [Proteobacteria bacterium]|nr:hypothetical protein [Pseudomonadota bacterium]